ncbi:hypothetical protein ACWIGI_35350 [Nocardia sp. NPDC055321]
MTHDDTDGYEDWYPVGIQVCTTQGDARTWTVKVGCHASRRDYLVFLDDGREGEWRGVGFNVFEAFAAARSEPEGLGFRFLVVGARPEFWPSGMSSDMGGGVLLYRHYPSVVRRVVGELTDLVLRRSPLHHMFDPAPLSRVATAAEQRAFRDGGKMPLI